MTSIIIPIRYRPDLTRVCVDSIIGYTNDYELIAVQEGEDKDITELLKSYPIKFLQNKTPKGYAGALNTGMEIAKGELFCFMNNDTVATPGWLSEMIEGFKDPDVGLVAPTFWGTGERQSVDFNRGQRFEWVLEPFSLMGVCFLISRQCMEVLDDPKWPGKWDEDFFHGGEDFDITMRVQRAHYKMVIARNSFIYHYGGASTRMFVSQDIDKVKKHHYEKILKLINKHDLDAEDTFQRLQIH
jgi:GT2 family glycosyltransferase